MQTEVYKNRLEMGAAAGRAVETEISRLLEKQREVRIIFAAAPSQNELLAYLRGSKNILWNRVVAFHMDEYIGLPPGAPQLFSSFLKNHLFDKVPLKTVHLMEGSGAPAEADRYTNLIKERPIDIVCLGIGENGHLAFNDPPVADFDDPKTVKVVQLDPACRQQQVNDGCFDNISEVPTHALTLTIPALLSAARLYCVVPGERKKTAVATTLHGPVSTSCPATILRRHQNCWLFLDEQSYGGPSTTGAEV